MACDIWFEAERTRKLWSDCTIDWKMRSAARVDNGESGANEALGYHPLAVEIAGSYLAKRRLELTAVFG
jgi:hypothetical protein